MPLPWKAGVFRALKWRTQLRVGRSEKAIATWWKQKGRLFRLAIWRKPSRCHDFKDEGNTNKYPRNQVFHWRSRYKSKEKNNRKEPNLGMMTLLALCLGAVEMDRRKTQERLAAVDGKLLANGKAPTTWKTYTTGCAGLNQIIKNCMRKFSGRRYPGTVKESRALMWLETQCTARILGGKQLE